MSSRFGLWKIDLTDLRKSRRLRFSTEDGFGKPRALTVCEPSDLRCQESQRKSDNARIRSRVEIDILFQSG
jgi:hypothetical protein